MYAIETMYAMIARYINNTDCSKSGPLYVSSFDRCFFHVVNRAVAAWKKTVVRCESYRYLNLNEINTGSIMFPNKTIQYYHAHA
jgi:hypothetical protein